MFMGLGMPIPDLSNKPGPGRPGWGPAGTYDFQFEVDGAVTIEANAAGAGNFRVSWPSGHVDILSGDNPSVAAPDGTAGIVSINNEELDTTYADEFKIVSGQVNVTKVISWGQNPWSNVFEAFKDCVNLTDISTTSFLASGQGPSSNQGCYMTKMFEGCTSLLEVDIRSWDLTAGVSWKTGSPFINLVNLEKLDATGLKIKFQDNNSYARNWFVSVGSATTNGCEFKLSGLDYSSTTNTGLVIDYIFSSAKFKDGSNLSNWKFPSHANSTYIYWFNSARISGTLDMSGWTTFNGTSLESMFYRFNQHLTAADGSKFNMSNWNFPYATSFYRMFWECEISEIIGLNTWGATNGSPINFKEMFKAATLMRINPSDNFSNAFSSSLNVGNVRDMCNALSSGLANADVGASPSFVGADFSSMTNSFAFMFRSAKIISSPDFSTCTFSASNPMNFGNIFYTTTITDTNNHFILNNQNLAISYISQAFWQTSIRRVTIGDNVDLSNLVTIDYMSYQAGFDTGGLTLPSNANYSSLTVIGQYAFANNALSTCQVDTFIRQNWETNLNTGLTCDLENNKITAAPSIARSNAASLSSVRTWNITLGSPDATLPFAYASYAVDPTGITTISPTVTPPAGSVFTATNSLSISSSGVITIGTFRGGSTIRCTYPDGCYNEVVMLIQVPFTMRTTIPANGSNFTLSPQMSNGECFVDWGDTNSQTLTASTTHNYTSSGTYDIKIFDSANGSKFTGFSSPWTTPTYTYEKSILKWGDIEWQNNNWFYSSGSNNTDNKIRVEAPAGSSNAPNLSNVTSLSDMFSSTFTANRTGYFEDVNGNLSDWDVSTITDMNRMFKTFDANGCTIDIRNWNVSNVENFSKWGENSSIIFNIDNWVTSSATDMSQMCNGVSSTSTGIENLVTTNVTTLYQFGYVTFDGNTKMVNNVLRWDVSNCTNFSAMGCNWATNSNFPSNWKLSDDASKNISMQQFCGVGALTAPYGVDDVNAFATKTINQSWHGGSSYVAWDVSNVTNFYLFGGQNNNVVQGGVFPNWNIGTWNITSKTTNMLNMFATGQWRGSIPNYFDQDLSGWDISGITSLNLINGATSRGRHMMNMSTSNYDATLIGWGAHAANAQSGVTVNFGISKYSPGNIFEGTQGTNTYQGNSIYGSGKDMEQFVSVGDVVERPPDPNGIFDTYAIVTGFNTWNGSRYLRATTQGNIGPSTYTVMDSDAAKGRVALINAGWTITDGGADIPFASTELIIDVNAGDTFTVFSSGSNNNYSVDWGDGNGFSSTPYTGTSATGPAYATGGEKTIKINKDSSEKINALYFYNQVGTINKIKKISNWGTNSWDSLYRAFKCHDTAADRRVHPDFTVESPTPPNFSNGPNINSIFDRCNVNNNIFTNSQVSNWNVRSLSSLYGVFYKCFGFNEDISGWDTSYITTFDYAFGYCSSLNSDISNWDTSRLTTMHTSFAGCSSLNADLNTKDTGSRLAWDVSKVSGFNSALAGTSMSYNIDKWQIKTTGGVYFQSLFNNCNWPNLTLTPKTVTVGSGAYQKTYLAWDTQQVTRMDAMIASGSFNTDIGKWDTSSVTTLDGFAKSNSVFNNGGQPMNARQVTVGTGTTARTYTAWDTSNISAWKEVFRNATSFNQDIGNWDLSGATGNVYRILENASSFNHEVDWVLPTGFTPNYAWGWFFFANTNMSTVNYTNTIVNFANTVYNNSGLYNATGNNIGGGQTFDSNMSGGANFANAWEARSYLTSTVASGGAGWTLSGDTVLPLLVPSTSSLSFNGNSGYINSYGSSSLNLTSALTVSMYIKIEDETNSGYRGLFTKGEITTAGFGSYSAAVINAQNNIRFYLNSGGPSTTPINITTTSGLLFDRWYHVCFTYDGSLSSNKAKTYIDGVNQSVSSSGTIPSSLYSNTSSNFHIGAYYNTSLLFEGNIDEVMIWDNVISTSNIQTLADAVGSGNVTNPEQLSTGLQLWNRMGD